jgi:hypothetical protein
MRQKLMTAAVRKALPPLYANAKKPLEDAVVVVKFFSPYAQMTWYVTEFDGRDSMFGYCDLGMGGAEWGYISLSELESLKVCRGRVQAVERDICWKPTRFGDIKTRVAA